MPRQYSLGAGTLIQNDPDPIELALKQAQLAKLLQDPASERAQIALQLQDQRLRGAIAAGQQDIGRGQLGLDTRKLEETLPIERGKLTVEQQRAADEAGYRKGSLAEETRFHTATNEAEKARVRAGLVGDIMTHMLPSEMSGQLPKGSVESAVTALGMPELAASMKSVANRAMLQKAIAFADQSKTLNEKQFGAATAGLPPGTEEEFRNAAWNRYKATHPEVYGKDVVAAAETALKPQEPTAAAAPTTAGGNYVAPGAGSPSVGWAMGPDSPLASTTPGLSALGPLKPQMGLVDPKTNEVLPLPGRETAPATKPSADQLVKAATATTPPPAPVTTPPTAAAPPVPANVRPPTMDVDKLLQSFVGNPTMEDLERRKRSALAATLTPYRTNQY
jgi:hypothetical protein